MPTSDHTSGISSNVLPSWEKTLIYDLGVIHQCSFFAVVQNDPNVLQLYLHLTEAFL